MASRRVPRGDFYDNLDFLSPDGRHRKGSAKTSADPTRNLSPLIQRRFSLLERRHRLVGWHREADITIMFILYFSPTPFHTPPLPQLQLFSLLTFYFALLGFSFLFPLHILVHSLSCGSLHDRDKEGRSLSILLISASPFLHLLPLTIQCLLYWFMRLCSTYCEMILY